MRRFAALFALCLALPAAARPNNVILFVPDGLRALMVTPDHAPAMAALATEGVTFQNSHSLFPTLTTANASGMATGHYLGDSGDFSNTLYVGFKTTSAAGSRTPFIENDPVLAELDAHFGGDYLNEITILAAARALGYNTAAIGKLGPTMIFSHTARDGLGSVVIDDQTGQTDPGSGRPKGATLAPWLIEAMTAQGLPLATPGRGANGQSGSATRPGTTTANVAQEDYFTAIATRILLPKFQRDNKPFLLVYWSRDPDGSQHNQGDSLNQLKPGINGPTSLAGIRNADTQLQKLRDSLAALGLAQNTDILVAADHGFSTIARPSRTSGAAQARYEDVTPGMLPSGFLALDLAAALDLPLFDPDAGDAPVTPGHHSVGGNALIGQDPDHPQLVVAANGGSDLIYLPQPVAPGLAARIIAALVRQDYVSGLFVDPKLGRFPGALPLSAINLQGKAVTPMPSILVNFRSIAGDCGIPTNCAIEIADGGLQPGQGMHGSFSRGDTYNFMAAVGPDFKRGFVDKAPVSNADVGQTIAALLQMPLPARGKLVGRVMREAMIGGSEPKVISSILRSSPTGDGLLTVLRQQRVGNQLYFDAAGFPGRTVGLDDATPP